jgi:hypothetical protein
MDYRTLIPERSYRCCPADGLKRKLKLQAAVKDHLLTGSLSAFCVEFVEAWVAGIVPGSPKTGLLDSL